MSVAITLPPGVHLCHLPSPFGLTVGGVLDGAAVGFELTGEADAPVIVVLGGISADRAPARWWPGVVGSGLAIDPTRYRVLSIDWLGGAGCSTAPAAGESFPFVSTADQANALHCVLDSLGIERVHTLVGASYGGMVGLEFAARHPERLDRLCVLAAADRSHPQASGWRAVQRGIVELGLRAGAGTEALALARGLAMTTYRSPGELAARFAAPGAIGSWLSARGDAFAELFLPEQFLCLNTSIDEHRVDPDAVAVPTTLVAFDSDQLVPLADVRRLAARLPHCEQLIEIGTTYGHDGFLKETAVVGNAITEVLS